MILPIYPNPGRKEIVETSRSMYVFKIRLKYDWVKQGGERIKPTTWRPGKPQPKSEPAKIYIELGGKGSIIHDENWEHFFSKGLVN